MSIPARPAVRIGPGATGRFKRAPMVVHTHIPEIGPTHFARWRLLFRQAPERLRPPNAAALFVAKSEMIARSPRLGVAAGRGELPLLRAEPARTNKPSDGGVGR